MDKLKKNIKNIFKKSEIIRNFGRYIRRVVFNSKYIYFLSSSPKPLSWQYGFDRGRPLDRYYIEDFLKNNARDIKGRCLEIHNDSYTKQYGAEKVIRGDVLDIEAGNKNATIVGDLRNLERVENNTYNCIILTQVLQFIDDLDAAVAEIHRVLAPGGIALVTLPSLSRADCISGPNADFWRFTTAGARYLFEKKFAAKDVLVAARGNARTGIYFYAGLAVEDVSRKVLDKDDENFPTIVTVWARKS